MLEQHEERVAEHVTANLFDRHIRPVFLWLQLRIQSGTN